MNRNDRLDDHQEFNHEKLDHQKFKELAALAQRGASSEVLSENERVELKRHLQACISCRQAYEEYALISNDGMDFLAAAYGFNDESRTWDDRPVRERLFARLRQAEGPRSVETARVLPIGRSSFPPSVMAPWAAAAVAACVLVAVAVGAYKLGGHIHVAQQQPIYTSTAEIQTLASEKAEERKTSSQRIASQDAQLSRLQNQVSIDQQEILRLRDALRSADTRYSAISAANSEAGQRFQQVSEQRDKLAAQLHETEQSYQLVQAELTTLRAERDRVLVHTTSLESKIDELNTSARDQEHRLKDDEQYLSSDRDIRELMGARKLYIADVFDVDSRSRTRKPFGRVFYTESKSLIFYAFDLDHEPGVKNASAFQVWGQRDVESGEKNHATNLGILYMDSESNRRWVLRLDDPKQLAEIDAVFVTVEPQGGSQKPTGKPFLYALLRREANHP